MTTLAPACARPWAMAKPMPAVPPVTRAVLPDKSMFMGLPPRVEHSAEAKGGYRGFHDGLAKDLAPGRIASGTCRDHQRQQMLLSLGRMAKPGRRCVGPVRQLLQALGGGCLHRLGQPAIEL